MTAHITIHSFYKPLLGTLSAKYHNRRSQKSRGIHALILQALLFSPMGLQGNQAKESLSSPHLPLKLKGPIHKNKILFVNSLPLFILPLNKLFKGKIRCGDNKEEGLSAAAGVRWTEAWQGYLWLPIFQRGLFCLVRQEKERDKTWKDTFLPSLKLSQNMFLQDFQ